MKKLLSLMLCLFMICGMLVSCDEDRVFGSFLPNYDDYEPEVEEKLTLNLYIITDDITEEGAKGTVNNFINKHTIPKYNTNLVVHYLTASKYQSKVTEEVNASDADSANIVLINSLSMMQNLVKSEKLADLTNYLKSDEYGALNVNIASALLESAKINGKFYAIPNNHVVGEYEYIVIDKWANDEYNVIPPSMFENDLGPKDLAGLDALVEELKEKLTENGYDPEDFISTVSGPYELQDEIEEDGKYECLVLKNPTADESVAFSSAFAVVDRGEDYNERAMEIIYAINMDKELRDLLQYGVVDINYYRDANDNIVYEKDGKTIDPNAKYSMNLIYTGNVFTASYCPDINWTQTVAENGKMQNSEAVAE